MAAKKEPIAKEALTGKPARPARLYCWRCGDAAYVDADYAPGGTYGGRPYCWPCRKDVLGLDDDGYRRAIEQPIAKRTP